MQLNTPFIRKILVCGAVLSLSSCANMDFNTNLDKERFASYFAPATVKIYQHESEFYQNYRYLGAVEGNSCQVKMHHRAPRPEEARTEARRQAAILGANGIVFEQCFDTSSPDCFAEKVCYGKAFLVDVND